jgi:5-oxoprolinase (ATP-hydrolysing)
VVRELEFRRPVKCSILSERRANAPYGMAGGEPAQRGLNYWVRTEPDGGETWINLGGKNTAPMQAGDRVVIMTPGGGGYGRPDGKKLSSKGLPSVAAKGPVANGSIAARKLLQESV